MNCRRQQCFAGWRSRPLGAVRQTWRSSRPSGRPATKEQCIVLGASSRQEKVVAGREPNRFNEALCQSRIVHLENLSPIEQQVAFASMNFGGGPLNGRREGRTLRAHSGCS